MKCFKVLTNNSGSNYFLFMILTAQLTLITITAISKNISYIKKITKYKNIYSCSILIARKWAISNQKVQSLNTTFLSSKPCKKDIKMTFNKPFVSLSSSNTKTILNLNDYTVTHSGN